MDLWQLHIFCRVVERKSFSQAAEINGVTQSAVSQRIAALEKELPAYAATGELLPKQRDLAGQKLSLAEATRQVESTASIIFSNSVASILASATKMASAKKQFPSTEELFLGNLIFEILY